MKVRSVAVIVLLLAVAGCDIKVNEGGVSIDIAEGQAADEWTRTYTLAPGGRLEIVNGTGAIEATGSDGGQVEVTASREVRTDSEETSRQLLQKIEMLEEVAPDRVRIEARATGWDESLADRLGRRFRVNYKVSLPQGLNVEFRTQNGGVRLQNVGGTIVAASTNGGINGRGVSGSLAASTVNGGIDVHLASVSDEVSLVTVNGGIRLELPAGVKGDLDARAVNGGVAVDEGLGLEATDRGRLHVTGRLNGGGPKISAQTTNGGVRVSVREANAAQAPPGPG